MGDFDFKPYLDYPIANILIGSDPDAVKEKIDQKFIELVDEELHQTSIDILIHYITKNSVKPLEEEDEKFLRDDQVSMIKYHGLLRRITGGFYVKHCINMYREALRLGYDLVTGCVISWHDGGEESAFQQISEAGNKEDYNKLIDLKCGDITDILRKNARKVYNIEKKEDEPFSLIIESKIYKIGQALRANLRRENEPYDKSVRRLFNPKEGIFKFEDFIGTIQMMKLEATGNQLLQLNKIKDMIEKDHDTLIVNSVESFYMLLGGIYRNENIKFDINLLNEIISNFTGKVLLDDIIRKCIPTKNLDRNDNTVSMFPDKRKNIFEKEYLTSLVEETSNGDKKMACKLKKIVCAPLEKNPAQNLLNVMSNEKQPRSIKPDKQIYTLLKNLLVLGYEKAFIMENIKVNDADVHDFSALKESKPRLYNTIEIMVSNSLKEINRMKRKSRDFSKLEQTPAKIDGERYLGWFKERRRTLKKPKIDVNFSQDLAVFERLIKDIWEKPDYIPEELIKS